jgi:serine/threonine-protein kinase
VSNEATRTTQELSREEIEAELKYHGFEIVRLLSDKGGMADVYEAWQPSVRRKIAAKRLKSHLVSNKDVKSRFEEEAMLLGRLNHPNIVHVIDYSSEKMTLFMEFIEGKPLDEILDEKERLPLEDALHIVASVLEGLAYAHARKIIHQDVKPGNIFITADGPVKLGDFGIATIIGMDARKGDGESGSWLGTPSYIAPEQLTGTLVDERADLYSVGVTLYLLITGKLPFVGGDSARTAAMRLTHDPAPPSSLNPMISQELDAIVLKALARSPEGRFHSAVDFRNAVNQLLSPRRELAYLQEAGAELEKARQATTTGKKRFLVSTVKLAQMALSENPDHPEARKILHDAQEQIRAVRKKEFLIFGSIAAAILAVVAVLVLKLSHGNGSIDFFTDEPADVYLDGSKIGTSPFLFSGVAAGTHRYYVEQPGFYKSAERQLKVEKGKVVSVSEPIPAGGTVVVSSKQPGSQVLLDGVEIGKTPLTRRVIVGKHKLEVSGVGRDVVVQENATETLSFGDR